MIRMAKECPITKVMTVLGKKWNLLVLRQLSDRKEKRFNELMKGLYPISSRTLAKRLRELEMAGLIEKEKFNEIPPRVEYCLTSSGKDLIKCFNHLNEWAKRHG